MRFFALVLLFAAAPAPAQQQPSPVLLEVDAAHPIAPYRPIWNYFGADEPNYTATPNGGKLLGELSTLSPSTPVYFRPHNLLTSGDSSGSLKWGSTGVYTEAPDGTPVYHWQITDQLFDNLVAHHIRPMVELGFMPEALSTHTTPYRHNFPAGDVFTGWSYPPKDYAKWRSLILAYTRHLHQRYGPQVEQWLWEVWNEPDIPYWHGTPEEYFKLYDLSTGAVRQELPNAEVGGPAVTGGGSNQHFLERFLEHCARGINADTGKPGAPLSFISFHPKGAPTLIPATAQTPAHVRMDLARQLSLTDQGFQTVARFPEYRQTPILLSETDPEGCAACKGPQNGYRNGTLYGVSVAEMLVRSAELARTRGVNLAGAITWAFEFEDQPPFAGFRELATNAPLATSSNPPGNTPGNTLIDKPVLNVFRLFGKLAGQLLPLTSSSTPTNPQLLANGVTGAPDIYGIATRSEHAVDILLFNYQDQDLEAAPTAIALNLKGLPATNLTVDQYLIDGHTANSYEAWKSLGSPQSLTPAQAASIRSSGTLAPIRLPTQPRAGTLHLAATLPRQAVTLYHIAW